MRNRYLDLLRAAAIVRVVVYHLFGWPWLSILLPAMGIMFALAGSLTAASLDKRAAGKVITSRLRRLLPPLWLLAAITVPAMLYAGWARESGGDGPMSWKLALWLLPVGDPPGSEYAIDVWEPLWYIRAYVWFVMLSPLLYLAYKKIGWAAVVAPIALIAALDKTGFSLPFGRADAAMWDFATYGACWIAGFAHHDGRLARLRTGTVLAAAAVLGGAALYWLRGHPGEGGYDLNEVSESQALWSLAFVLVALRWQPDMAWLALNRPLDAAVNLLNARAVTIYLWHNIAIAAIWPLLTVVALDDVGQWDAPVDLAASVLLTVMAVLAFGWAEDLAARRRPRLWPVAAGSARASDPALPGRREASGPLGRDAGTPHAWGPDGMPSGQEASAPHAWEPGGMPSGQEAGTPHAWEPGGMPSGQNVHTSHAGKPVALPRQETGTPHAWEPGGMPSGQNVHTSHAGKPVALPRQEASAPHAWEPDGMPPGQEASTSHAWGPGGISPGQNADTSHAWEAGGIPPGQEAGAPHGWGPGAAVPVPAQWKVHDEASGAPGAARSSAPVRPGRMDSGDRAAASWFAADGDDAT